MSSGHNAVFKSEEFWRDTWDFVFSEQRFAAAPDEVSSLLELAGFPQEGEEHVLDLPCGPGRHAVELARRGMRVTGVDRTPYLLDAARKHAAEQSVEVEWVEEDMRRFRRDGAFDLALNLFSSFGYFETPDEDFKVLENFAACLQPSGKLVLDLFGKEGLAERFQPTVSFDLPDGGVLVDRHEIRDAWGSVHTTWHVIRGEKTSTYRFQLRLYSARELQDLLKRAGFVDIEIYGNFKGMSYGPGAERLVIVATGPAGSRVC